MENLREKLITTLKPYYDEILTDLEPKNTTFLIQFGEKFPTEENKGIIFVGRSVNG